MKGSRAQLSGFWTRAMWVAELASSIPFFESDLVGCCYTTVVYFVDNRTRLCHPFPPRKTRTKLVSAAARVLLVSVLIRVSSPKRSRRLVLVTTRRSRSKQSEGTHKMSWNMRRRPHLKARSPRCKHHTH
jgi:hypothetical protein